MPTISFKVSESEAARLRRAAKGRSLSEYLRAAALPPLPKVKAIYRTKTDKATGLPVTVTPPGLELSSEEVREALADFP